MKHLMLDIETLDTATSAVVIQAKGVQLIMAELKNNTDETHMSHLEDL